MTHNEEGKLSPASLIERMSSCTRGANSVQTIHSPRAGFNLFRKKKLRGGHLLNHLSPIQVLLYTTNSKLANLQGFQKEMYLIQPDQKQG